MLPWLVAGASAIGLAFGCSSAPQDAAPPLEQTAVVSKDQARAIMERANMQDAGPSSSDEKERAGDRTIEAPPSNAPMTYRQGLKKITRDLGEGQ